MKKATLAEFLSSPKMMMEYRGVWQDGSAGVSFLTGTHVGSELKNISYFLNFSLHVLLIIIYYIFDILFQLSIGRSWVGHWPTTELLEVSELAALGTCLDPVV